MSTTTITKAAEPASHDALANLTDESRFGLLQRVATMMGSSSLTPKHLRGSCREEAIANCFRVTNQAMRWGFDPFAVGDETYVVHGRLGYQGKLVAGVINARAGLRGRLKATYAGEGDALTVTISGQFTTEDEARTITLNLKQARTDNEMWKKDPEQKLFYSGVIKWARRHCPELILGTLTDDDLERMAAAPPSAPTSSIDEEILETKPVVEAEKPKLAEDEIPNDPEPAKTEPKVEKSAAGANELADNLITRIEQAKNTTQLDGIRGEWMRSKGNLGADLADKVKAAWDVRYKAVKK